MALEPCGQIGFGFLLLPLTADKRSKSNREKRSARSEDFRDLSNIAIREN